MTIEVGVLIAITIGIVEVLKKIDTIPSKYIPVLAIIVGVLLTLISGYEPASGLITGLIVSLSAMGLYSGSKSTIGK